jgi:hypothetical protein
MRKKAIEWDTRKMGGGRGSLGYVAGNQAGSRLRGELGEVYGDIK